MLSVPEEGTQVERNWHYQEYKHEHFTLLTNILKNQSISKATNIRIINTH